jgi:exosortase E/protease (VPEID-CTERM system)
LPGRLPLVRWTGLALLLAAEVAVFALHFDPWLSRGRLAVLEAAACAVLVTIVSGRWALRGAVARALVDARGWQPWLAAHLLGATALYGVTLAGVSGRVTQSPAGRAWLAAWVACLVATLGCWLAAVVAPRAWLAWMRQAWPAVLAGVAAAVLWFFLRSHAHVWIHAWHQEQLLALLAAALGLLGHEVVLDTSRAVIGTPQFNAVAGSTCMGYEGVVLVSLFTAGFLWVFRRSLRFPRALLLVPLAAAVSYGLNVVRILALIEIGIRWPAVAMDGFHSVAGWYSVAAVSLGVVVASQRLCLRGGPDATAPARRGANPAAFYLVPLLLIVATAMLTRIVATGFDALYPVRVVACAIPLWIHRRRLRDLGWRGSAWAIPVGIATFVMWLALEPAATAESSIPGGLAALPAGAAAAWLAFRALGSIATVAVAEELAFRGYLGRKLVSADFERVPLDRFTWLSFLGSSVLFGALHGRWLAGTLAGMIFALTLYRRGKLADPIVAHATANALVALAVLATGRWTLWE